MLEEDDKTAEIEALFSSSFSKIRTIQLNLVQLRKN